MYKLIIFHLKTFQFFYKLLKMILKQSPFEQTVQNNVKLYHFSSKLFKSI